jgi:AhpD family alkylhydroperoxidase
MRPVRPAPAPECPPRRAYRTPRALLADAWPVVRSAPRLYAIYARKRLDPALRERIAIAVSRANSCRACTRFHERGVARRGAAGTAPSPRICGDGSTLDLAVAYAAARTESTPAPPDPRMEVALRERLGAEEMRDIDAIIRLMTLANLSVNTFALLHGRLPLPGKAGARDA